MPSITIPANAIYYASEGGKSYRILKTEKLPVIDRSNYWTSFLYNGKERVIENSKVTYYNEDVSVKDIGDSGSGGPLDWLLGSKTGSGSGGTFGWGSGDKKISALNQWLIVGILGFLILKK